MYGIYERETITICKGAKDKLGGIYIYIYIYISELSKTPKI